MNSQIHVRIFSILTSALAVVSMSAFLAPTASAAGDQVVTSSRSFKGQQSRYASLLKEAAATSVDSDSSWGGVENLEVPKTESQAEKDAKARAEAEVQAQQAREQAAAASRTSAGRTSFAQSESAEATDSPSAAVNPSAVTAPTSASGAAVVSYALQFQGVPYVYGGTTPSGWDCSGFTSYVYRQFGLEIGRTDADQRAYAVAHGVKVTNPEPGDLMWKSGHVGIYIGGGQMVHASTPSTGTIVSSASYANFEYYRII
ncbi:peptidoglycan endopeptidase [Bifidobacterium tissieri]|uniref:Peptidoglycan endopeptidase n=2 Tax=Bifidobacterium tissieri TaxID=1630162 RepID=A0A5M9ZXE4_9BIFI|nr:peptidoglycan endopeptidase [Bifidobacterium tissieri]KAA8831933.1 peptidoglycan endopeptidase [Bifidobacterium tissieri]